MFNFLPGNIERSEESTAIDVVDLPCQFMPKLLRMFQIQKTICDSSEVIHNMRKSYSCLQTKQESVMLNCKKNYKI